VESSLQQDAAARVAIRGCGQAMSGRTNSSRLGLFNLSKNVPFTCYFIILYHKIYLKYYGLCHLWQKLYLISSKYTLQFLLIARYYIKLIHGRLLLLYWQPNGLMSRLDRAALFLAGKKKVKCNSNIVCCAVAEHP
jgi:hypothetical protein